MPPEEAGRRDACARRLLQAFVEGGNLISIYVGDRLGLYQALADLGPVTPGELAARAGTHERYTRERLEQQAVARIIEGEGGGAGGSARRDHPSPGQAEALPGPRRPNHIASLPRIAHGGARPLPP